MMTVDAQLLFPAALEEIYDALRARMLELGADVIEEFSRTQVSYGAARKFVWLTPITKTKALLTVDMWEEHQATFLRSVIPFRHSKYTHQIEVRTAADIHTVAALGWFEESAAWGRKER
jgi:predicted transport protein